MKEGGRVSGVGRWLFRYRVLVAAGIGVVAMGLIAVGDRVAGTKHISSCESIVIDVVAGTVSGLSPAVSAGEVMGRFPCYTGDAGEGSSGNGGGGVFCKHHGLFFYTQADRIEIRNGFDGQLAGMDRPYVLGDFTTLLGDPEETREESMVEGGAIYDVAYHFSTSYGSLTLFGRDGQIHALHLKSRHGEQGAGDST